MLAFCFLKFIYFRTLLHIAAHNYCTELKLMTKLFFGIKNGVK